MKRTSATVDLALYAAMFKDVVAWRPDLRISTSRDFARLEELEKDSLESFLMIDLVSAGKIVDKALSTGRINPHALPATLGSVVGGGSREFLSGLFGLVFDSSDGTLRTDAEVEAVFFLRQVIYLAKKVRKECSNASIAAEVSDFSVIDRNLRYPTLNWDAGDSLGTYSRLSFTDGHRQVGDWVSGRDSCPRALLRAFDRVCGRLFSKLPRLELDELRPSHGPGAVADARSGADKYLFPTWPDKLEVLFPHNYFARSREDLDITDPIDYSCEEFPARLIAVPKTLKGPRMIASEPTAHQYIQHALMEWLRQHMPRLLRPCVDFKDQEPSRALCLEASSTGSLATVDLSSASDRLSCWVVERAFQYNRDVLDALWACRTRCCRISVRDADGVLAGEEDFLLLRKFAPMGSGVTFPVQSLVYAAMAIAVVLYDEGKGARVTDRTIRSVISRVRVFGDDIILPTSSVSSLDLLLTHCQLKLNASKTHWQGLFRESCGMDAFRGSEVTPVYLRDFQPGHTGEDLVSWVAVSNNAHAAWLINLAEYMVERLPEEQRKLIPLSSMKEPLPSLTLTTYSPSPPEMGDRRWNSDLQRFEVKALVLSAQRTWRERDGYQSLLQYFVEDPSPLIKWRSGVIGRQRLRLRKQWVESHHRNV